MPTRTANAKWEGGLKGGRGNFSVASGLGGDFSFSSRFESGSASNPEELLAAAYASCFSMALAAALEKNGTPSTSVATTANATLEKVGDAFSITKINLTVNAVVPNVDDPTFQRFATATKDGCIIARALKGNMDLQMVATLQNA
jgi:osmotically inducible protein OsmC